MNAPYGVKEIAPQVLSASANELKPRIESLRYVSQYMQSYRHLIAVRTQAHMPQTPSNFAFSKLRDYLATPKGVLALMWFWKTSAFLSVFKVFYANQPTIPLVLGVVGTSALALGFTFHNARLKDDEIYPEPASATERRLKLAGYLAIVLLLALVVYEGAFGVTR